MSFWYLESFGLLQCPSGRQGGAIRLFVLLCFLDDFQTECLAEFGKGFADVAVDGDPVPAELVPLVEELSDVAADFGNQLGAAAFFTVQSTDSLCLMDDHLFTSDVCAEAGGHVSGGH